MAPDARSRWTGLSFAGLLEALRRERLLPLALNQADAPCDPLLLPLREQFDRDAEQRVAQEDSLLVRALAALSARGCRSLLLKGAALGRWLYPRPVLRPATDVDLLVAPEQHLEAHAALVESGFESDGYSQHDAATCQACYRHSAGGAQLDLHWALGSIPELACRFRFDDLWQRSIALHSPPGARALGRVDALMHAVVHYCAHLPVDQRPALWLYDIALLARGLTEAEWADLDQRVRASGLAGLHAATLAEAAHWFPLQLSDARQRAWTAIGIRESTRHWLQPTADPAGRFWRSLRSLPGLRSRLAFLRARLFPSADWMRGRYRARSLPALILAYARRWISGWRSLAQ